MVLDLARLALLSLLWLLSGAFSEATGAFTLPDLPRKTPDKALHSFPSLHFSGRLEALDLRHHPMTLTAILGEGHPMVFRFAGVLVPDTMVLSGGKAVGVKALKRGQPIQIDYHEGPKGGEIQKIFLLVPPPPSSEGGTPPSPDKNPPQKTQRPASSGH
ncbi:MAG: hypothetical protein ACP5OP_03295 [Leptospirillia bacterium]